MNARQGEIGSPNRNPYRKGVHIATKGGIHPVEGATKGIQCCNLRVFPLRASGRAGPGSKTNKLVSLVSQHVAAL